MAELQERLGHSSVNPALRTSTLPRGPIGRSLRLSAMVRQPGS